MTATAFPAYKIARFLVGRRAALFAAAASVMIPALAYSSLILQESLAYPYSTLCLYLILGALIRHTRGWIIGAAVASLVAPLVRGELAVIPAVFVLAMLFVLWRSDAAATWRARWGTADWIAGGVLVVGVALLLSAFLGHRSTQWLIATGFYKHRMFTLGMRAAGAFTGSCRWSPGSPPCGALPANRSARSCAPFGACCSRRSSGSACTRP